MIEATNKIIFALAEYNYGYIARLVGFVPAARTTEYSTSLYMT
jgi:hypothetical protein